MPGLLWAEAGVTRSKPHIAKFPGTSPGNYRLVELTLRSLIYFSKGSVSVGELTGGLAGVAEVDSAFVVSTSAAATAGASAGGAAAASFASGAGAGAGAAGA